MSLLVIYHLLRFYSVLTCNRTCQYKHVLVLKWWIENNTEKRFKLLLVSQKTVDKEFFQWYKLSFKQHGQNILDFQVLFELSLKEIKNQSLSDIFIEGKYVKSNTLVKLYIVNCLLKWKMCTHMFSLNYHTGIGEKLGEVLSPSPVQCCVLYTAVCFCSFLLFR